MSKLAKKASSPHGQSHASQALRLFEDALLELERHSSIVPAPQVPALPLPSLLQQCEAALSEGPANNSPIAILYSMPGLKPLSESWWEKHGIFAITQRLSPDRTKVDLGGLTALAARQGRPLVLTAEIPCAPVMLQNAARRVLLVCHPYLSFHSGMAGKSETLTAFCVDINQMLDDTQESVIVCVDQDEACGTAIARGLALSPLGFEYLQPQDFLPKLTALPPHFDGGADYVRLCQRLGYAPQQLPVEALGQQMSPPPAHFRAAIAQTQHSTPALISDFMMRAVKARAQSQPQAASWNTLAVVSALDACAEIGEKGFLDHLDRISDRLSLSDAAFAYLAAGVHFKNLGQSTQARSLIGEALLRTPAEEQWIRVLAAAMFAELGADRDAVVAVMDGAFDYDLLDANATDKLQKATSKALVPVTGEHGHSLLVSYLEKQPLPIIERQRVMIEVGTTREILSDQASTRKLSALCFAAGTEFITVDMDPRNGRNADRMFARQGLPFRAHTAKGEDFLAAFDRPIDIVFLDAYDFDHGNHSEVRQARYEVHLGARIDEAQCHQMHLDCAVSLISKLAPDGLICFDDTWLDTMGKWTAKGTTAMPFLLDNGFEVIDARNRAALLKRRQ